MKRIASFLLIYFCVVFVGLVCVQPLAHAFSVYENYPISSCDFFSLAQQSDAASVVQDDATAQDSAWTLQGSSIVHQGELVGFSSFTFGDTTWTDCVVGVTLDIAQGREAGVLLHYQDNRNYYKCIINAVYETVSVVRVVDGVATTLDEVTIEASDVQTMYIDFYKDEIAVFVNDEAKILVTDATLFSGKVGFFTQDAPHVVFNEPAVECRVDKVSVLGHLTDVISTNSDVIEFPLLTDKVRVGEIGLTAVQMPEGAVFELGSFNWDPDQDQIGDFDLTFEAVSKDGKQREKKSITVTVFASAQSGMANANEPALEAAQGSAVVTSVQPVAANSGAQPESTPAESSVMPSSTPVPVSASTQPTALVKSVGNVDYSGVSSPTVILGGSTPVATTPTTLAQPLAKTPQAPPSPVGVAPDMPLFTNAPTTSLAGEVTLSWTDRSDSGATIYLVEESFEDSDFTDPRESWVTNTTLVVSILQNGTYYYRVSAYTAQDGLGSETSPYSAVSAYPDRGYDVLEEMTQRGVFDHLPDSSSSTFQFLTNEPDMLDNYAIKFNYDVREQGFTGVFLVDPLELELDISSYKTIHYRVKTDVAVDGPTRVVLELKYDGAVVGSVLVNEITDEYTEHSFPVYCEGGMIEEVVLVVLRDSDPDYVGSIYFDEIFFTEDEFVPALSPEVPAAVSAGMTDEALLDTIESDMAHYFYYESIGPGYVKDTNKTAHASIASTGFGLAALTILAERYEAGSDNWGAVAPDDARSRAYQIISSLLYVQETLQDGLEAQYGKAGCFYHFIDGNGARIGTSEVSTVDTAILVMGALTAGEYFGGDVKVLADQLFDNIDWTFFLDRESDTFYMGWKPERSFDFDTYKEGGFLSNATYDVYTDEIFMIALAAMGRHPMDEDVRNSFYAFDRTATPYLVKNGAQEGAILDVVNSYYGSLFTYIYAHCFVDFEMLGADKPTDGSEPIDWWVNSYNAIVADKDFCVDRSEHFPFSFDEGNSWGISACEMPTGRYEGLYGGAPASNGPHHDGTVTVTMPICALPFYKADEVAGLSDNEGFQAMKYYYEHHRENLYGDYGFYGSYDDRGRFSTTFVGIDVGSALLMVENYRSRLIWETLLTSERLMRATDMAFNESFNYVDAQVCTIGTDQVVDAVSFGDAIAPGSEVVSALQYIKVDFNLQDENAQVAVYTDNFNNEQVPFTGDGDAAGLIGNVDQTARIPLYWTVFADKPTETYEFTDVATVGFMQDVSMTGFDLTDARTERMIVDGLGALAAYPAEGRTTDASTVYVCLGADFSQAEAQRYSTETITIEISTLS